MDFTAVTASAVGESDVLVVVIGSGWLDAADSVGRRRLDDPWDWVATEIGAALHRRIMIIPELVDGAQMPSRAQLSCSWGSRLAEQRMDLLARRC